MPRWGERWPTAERTWGTSTSSAILTATSSRTGAATTSGQGSLGLRQALHKLRVAGLQLQALRVGGRGLSELAVEEERCAWRMHRSGEWVVLKKQGTGTKRCKQKRATLGTPCPHCTARRPAHKNKKKHRWDMGKQSKHGLKGRVCCRRAHGAVTHPDGSNPWTTQAAAPHTCAHQQQQP